MQKMNKILSFRSLTDVLSNNAKIKQEQTLFERSAAEIDEVFGNWNFFKKNTLKVKFQAEGVPSLKKS